MNFFDKVAKELEYDLEWHLIERLDNGSPTTPKQVCDPQQN